jgi:hypothetical protein
MESGVGFKMRNSIYPKNQIKIGIQLDLPQENDVLRIRLFDNMLISPAFII